MPEPAAQFSGRAAHGELLVTVFPAVGDQPACAQAEWRADEWDTFDPPVRLAVVTGSVAIQ